MTTARAVANANAGHFAVMGWSVEWWNAAEAWCIRAPNGAMYHATNKYAATYKRKDEAWATVVRILKEPRIDKERWNTK